MSTFAVGEQAIDSACELEPGKSFGRYFSGFFVLATFESQAMLFSFY
jgi:hypothetical protein